MSDTVPNALGALVRDVLSAFGVPGGSTLTNAATAAIRDYKSPKEQELRKLLLEELEAGEKSIADVAMQDQLFGIWLRLRHACITGVAREKLRIMARVLSGQLQDNRLSTDAFSRLAGIIEGLSIQEIVYLVTLHELEGQAAKDDKERGDQQKAIDAKIKERLIPKYCADEEFVGGRGNSGGAYRFGYPSGQHRDGGEQETHFAADGGNRQGSKAQRKVLWRLSVQGRTVPAHMLDSGELADCCGDRALARGAASRIVEDSIDVAPLIEHPDDFNCSGSDAIEDHVTLGTHGAQTAADIVAGSADMREALQSLGCTIDAAQHLVGGRR